MPVSQASCFLVISRVTRDHCRNGQAQIRFKVPHVTSIVCEAQTRHGTQARSLDDVPVLEKQVQIALVQPVLVQGKVERTPEQNC